MDNPFESGHIKNYILLYVSVVVIMILFFIASNLFYDVQNIEKKVFKIEKTDASKTEKPVKKTKEEALNKPKFKLLDKAY